MGLLIDAIVRGISQIAASKSLPPGWKVATKVNAKGALVIALVVPPREGDPNQWRLQVDDEGGTSGTKVQELLRAERPR